MHKKMWKERTTDVINRQEEAQEKDEEAMTRARNEPTRGRKHKENDINCCDDP